MVTLLLAHPTNVYRTQREEDESRKDHARLCRATGSGAPGVGGKSMVELELRTRFQVNVIGYLERTTTFTVFVPIWR